MSLKDRLNKKTEGLFVPAPKKDDVAATTSGSPLKTGPGQMLMVSSLMRESNDKVLLLEDRLKEFDGALLVRLIPSDKVVASKWANRISANFKLPEFLAFKQEIKDAGGNVEPIKIRPKAGSEGIYEIVYGHRRHRACFELGLPVLALIEDVTDVELFTEMDRENRGREDLSPWEQGRMYKQALDEGLYSSLGDLSKSVGVDKGNLSKCLKLAELPDAVVKAFPSPLDLQFRWAKILNDALSASSEAVLNRAKAITDDAGTKFSANKVFELLIDAKPEKGALQEVVINGKSLAKISDSRGLVTVQFLKGALNQDRKEQLQSLLEDFLKN